MGFQTIQVPNSNSSPLWRICVVENHPQNGFWGLQIVWDPQNAWIQFWRPHSSSWVCYQPGVPIPVLFPVLCTTFLPTALGLNSSTRKSYEFDKSRPPGVWGYVFKESVGGMFFMEATCTMPAMHFLCHICALHHCIHLMHVFCKKKFKMCRFCDIFFRLGRGFAAYMFIGYKAVFSQVSISALGSTEQRQMTEAK